VWFIYLPIVAIIAQQVSPLWRSKLLLGITYSADCLAFAVMTHLLWPTRSQQYFLLTAKDNVLNDELEEFNEAPHVVNSYVRRSAQRHSFRPTDPHIGGPQQDISGSISAFDDCKDNTPLIIT